MEVYRGHELTNPDYQALQGIISLVGSEPVIKEKLEWNHGYPYAIIIKDHRITGLSIYGKNLTSIPEPVSRLIELTTLNLGVNQINEIKWLNKLIKLKELYLGYNQISEIKGLEGLVELTTLNLWSNQISEIKGLEELVELKELILADNRISEIKELDKLTKLKWIILGDNLINPNDPMIQELENRGVEVYYL